MLEFLSPLIMMILHLDNSFSFLTIHTSLPKKSILLDILSQSCGKVQFFFQENVFRKIELLDKRFQIDNQKNVAEIKKRLS